MTIQKVTDAILEALFQEFGSDYELYTESVEQGLTEPCFLVRCLNPTKNLDLGRRYKRTNQFSVQYFPATSRVFEECSAVAEKLFECLKDVVVHEKPVHGTELNGQIIDGILTFTVNYDGFVLEEYMETNMESLKTEAKVKG